jgi:RNA polymerase sigma-70 factor (ECF subfamily)
MTPLLARNQSAERAFERLYRAHVRDIYRYALMVTRNPDDAEDVVQTTFMKAFRAFEGGERPDNPRHWLIKIAHNTCRTRFRDAKRRPQEVAFEERLTEAATEHDGVQPAELLRALGQLTFNQRAALVMRELEGRSYAEIARVLELSPSAVETVLFRARRALREQLDGSLECGDAELALSRDLDGRLDRAERAQLRAHLRACGECAGLARRQRARRAALGALGPVPLPASLASWGGGAAVGTGVAVKIAAVVAAGAVAAGAGYEAADAVPSLSSRERTAVIAPRVARVFGAPASPATRIAAAAAATPHVLRLDKRRLPERGESTTPAAPLEAVKKSAGSQPARPQSRPAASLVQATVEAVSRVTSVPKLPAPPRLPVEVPAVPAPVVPTPALPPLPVEPPPVEAPPVPPVVPGLP